MLLRSPECSKVINLHINLVESSGSLGREGADRQGFHLQSFCLPLLASCVAAHGAQFKERLNTELQHPFNHKVSAITEAPSHQKNTI